MTEKETCETCLFHAYNRCCNFRSLHWCSFTGNDETCSCHTPSEEDEAIQLRREVEEQLG